MTHRLHMVALPHTSITDRNLSCAYTQKLRKFARVMSQRGHDVFVYGPEEADGLGSAVVVPIHREEERAAWGFPEAFNTVSTPLEWDGSKIYWQVTNVRAAEEIAKRAEQKDLILLSTSVQMPVAYANPTITAVEYGVGYEGIAARFSCFESYTWQHHVYGLQANWHPDQDWRQGRAFDRVIPNLFDPKDFPEGKPDVSEPYLLFMGRLIERKGPHIAALIAQACNLPLAVAGPGDPNMLDALVPGVPYIWLGELGPEDRATVMGGAAALLVPTQYLEPFGGVAVEGMMCGTPAVASDWGAFTETVIPDVSGYRFRTLQDGVDAVHAAMKLNRRVVREHALKNYALNPVARQYEDWFDALLDLWGNGWYTRRGRPNGLPLPPLPAEQPTASASVSRSPSEPRRPASLVHGV